MAITPTLVSFDPSVLIGYYNAKLPISTAATAALKNAAQGSATQTTLTPPWDSSVPQPAQEAQDAWALGNTPFIDTSKLPQSGAATTDAAKADQDYQKLFTLYQGLNRLAYLAGMASRDGTLSGQLPGLDTRFQNGLLDIQNFLSTATFNNFTLLPGTKMSSVTSTAGVPLSQTNYVGGVVVKGDALFQPLSNVSASDSFTIGVTKGGVQTNVQIDLANVSGPLTLDNIAAYINQQLSDGGFSTRVQRTVISDGNTDTTNSATGSTSASSTGTSGTSDANTDPISKKTFGLEIKTTASETLSFSAASATPALYLAGSTGSATDGAETGRLIKLTDLDGTQRAVFNTQIAPDSGTAEAKASVVDANGNIYVVGNTTGSFANQITQGSQDVFLTKYDSAGKVLWQRLLGSQDEAAGFSLALDPTGGVVVAGTTTGMLTGDSVGGGKDSFVAKFAGDGTQKWLHQVDPLANDQAYAVSVDASGNVYYAGQVSGTIAAGQTSSGMDDAYVGKLDATGKTVYRQQFGTSGNDQVSQMATTSDGGLVVASVQNGHAIVSKYAGGDATTAPLWQMDLGDLKGGTLGGIAVSGNQIYLSGATTNTALTAGGQANIAHASSGGSDAFVFRLNDAGASASADYVSYVGTSATDTGANLAVASDGSVYLTGTTRGTFAGQTQSFANAPMMFVSALDASGNVNWTRQYGGTGGQSAGAGIALDEQGSSVLDTLGLPRGTVSLTQSVRLTDQTTLKEGDSFTLSINGRMSRDVTIRISADETMSSLAAKINSALTFNGEAKVTYNAQGAALNISANDGVQIALKSGPDGQDALGGLGISPTILVGKPKTDSNSDTSVTSSTQKQIFGLGLPKALDLLTTADAKSARGQLLGVLSSLRGAYRTLTTPDYSTMFGPAVSGPAPAYLQKQIASYTLALNALSGGHSA